MSECVKVSMSVFHLVYFKDLDYSKEWIFKIFTSTCKLYKTFDCIFVDFGLIQKDHIYFSVSKHFLLVYLQTSLTIKSFPISSTVLSSFFKENKNYFQS